MSAADRLREIMDRRIAVLDGSWGVLIHRRGLSEADYRGERLRDHGRDVKGDPDLLNITRPSLVAEIHDAYFEAGADIATTNTFTATSIGQGDYDLQHFAAEMSREGARLARAAADAWTARTPDRPRFVAGAVGPLNRLALRLAEGRRSCVPLGDVRGGAGELRGADRSARRGRDRPPSDRDDLRHAQRKAAIVAAADVAPELPLWLSFTAIDRSGRNLSGQTAEAFWVSVEHARPLVVGVNCSLGAREMRPFLEGLARAADTYVSCYPNAGLPNAMGEHDEAAGRHEPPPPRIRRGRPRQCRRRLLRDDAGAHPPDRGRGRRDGRTADSRPRAADPLERPRAVRRSAPTRAS